MCKKPTVRDGKFRLQAITIDRAKRAARAGPRVGRAAVTNTDGRETSEFRREDVWCF